MALNIEWTLTDLRITCEDQEVLTYIKDLIWDAKQENYVFDRVHAEELNESFRKLECDPIATDWASILIYIYGDLIASDTLELDMEKYESITYTNLFDYAQMRNDIEFLDINEFLFENMPCVDPDTPVLSSLDEKYQELVKAYIRNNEEYGYLHLDDYIQYNDGFIPPAVYPAFKLRDNIIEGEYYVRQGITSLFYSELFKRLLDKFSVTSLEDAKFNMDIIFIDITSRKVYAFEDGFQHEYSSVALKEAQ